MVRYTRRLWIPEEDRVVDRHARALASGRYQDVSDAARACRGDIKRLYARLVRQDPHHWVASRLRPFGSIRRRIRHRLATLGLAWQSQFLAPAEARLLDRHVRGLVEGRYHDAREAAEACQDELARLAPGLGRTRPLSLRQAQGRIYRRAGSSMSAWSHRRWLPGERQLVERYARMVESGRYPGSKRAARVCHAELLRRHRNSSSGRAAGRTFRVVFYRLSEAARDRGIYRFPRWLPEERKVLDRYLRALYEGRYRCTWPAARDCARELEALRQGKSAGVHTAAAVYSAMVHAISRLGIPRYKAEATRQEQQLYERYARALASGRYGSCLDAALACLVELRGLARRVGQSGRLHVCRPAGRTRRAVANHIREAARRLGLRIPRQPWCKEEERVFAAWLRWYERYRRVRRWDRLAQAGSGLHDDLAKLGYTRSVCACRERLVSTRRRMHGGG